MTEDFLQYIWKYRLFNTTDLHTTTGQSVFIHKTGVHNFNAGPDFLNAKIKIGKQLWSGQVEIHIRSSDWRRHKHHENPQYKNVILHVVYENDEDIFLKQEGDLPVLVLKGIFDEGLWSRYENWLRSTNWIPCEKQIHLVERLTWIAWKDRLLVERLEQKSRYILDVLEQTGGDWQETFYRVIARNFGFKINAPGMEMLAESLPQRVLARHRSDPFQVEALLFGQAGFLDGDFKDEYPRSLKSEYSFLRKKHGLNPIHSAAWRMSRLRPSNFPQLRIAQLADLICRSEHLLSLVIDMENAEKLLDLFQMEAHPYWKNHYRFDVEGANRKSLKMGSASVENILINSVAPTLFCYGRYYDNENLITASQKILELCKAEKNSILDNWIRLKVDASNAADSQSLLWLYNEYCTKKRCLECSIGLELLKKN